MEKKNDKSAEAVLSEKALKEISDNNRVMVAAKKEEASTKTKRLLPKNDKAGKAEKPKITKPTKTDKPKAAGVNEWGHRIGSGAAKIDEAVKKVAKGKTPEVGVIAKETGLSNARIFSHLKHLKESKLI